MKIILTTLIASSIIFVGGCNKTKKATANNEASQSGALAAAKLGIKVAHVEAGLRSFNRSMPEEINRVLTDHCSDLLLTTSSTASERLLAEGIAADKVVSVGDVMCDVALRYRDLYSGSAILQTAGVAPFV